MPVLGYCLWVGSVLLALMFVADVYLPAQPPTEVHRTYNIPIKSAHVGPPSLKFSGETRNFGPPPSSMTIVDFAAQTSASKPADAKQGDPRRQAHAQMTNAPSSVEPKAKSTRKKIAKRKVRRDRDFAHVPEQWRQNRDFGFAFARPLW